MSDKPSILIKENEDKIFEIIPELKTCKGFEQNNIWHIYDVYEHILHVVDGVSNNLILRLAALFHDIGKPFTYTEDELGVGHFYGHWDVSKEIFERFIQKFDLDTNTSKLISNLILYHDLNVAEITENKKNKLLNTFDKNGIDLLFQLKRSDLLAQNDKFHYLLTDYQKQKDNLIAEIID